MNVFINGEARVLRQGTTVADVVARAAPSTCGIAVAVNKEVVTRSTWRQRVLDAGDRVEILGASQGG
jgi:sulfur carrier protein